MKQLFTLLCAAVIVTGCATSHINPGPSVPVSTPAIHASATLAGAPVGIIPVNTNVAVELQALRAASVSPGLVPVAPVSTSTSTPTKSTTPVAASVAPAVIAPSPVVTGVDTSTTKAGNTVKSHKLLFLGFALIGLSLVGTSYLTRKYWQPLWTKFLAWVKAHDVVSDLKTLASEAETKIEGDFKDVETEIKQPKPSPVQVPVPSAVLTSPASHPATTSAEKAFASAEVKKA